MSLEPIPLLGGKSIHCINEHQMREGIRLAEDDPVSSPKIQQKIRDIEDQLSRNEQAALAFLIIKHLKDSSI